MTITITHLEAAIAERNAELADLQAALAVAQEKARKQTPEQALAVELHAITCVHNHEDGCGWFYEFTNKQDNWSGSAHARYLKKATAMICQCEATGADPMNALKLFKMIQGV